MALKQDRYAGRKTATMSTTRRWTSADLALLPDDHRLGQTRRPVQDERHGHNALESGKAVEVQTRRLAIPTMHIANTDR